MHLFFIACSWSALLLPPLLLVLGFSAETCRNAGSMLQTVFCSTHTPRIPSQSSALAPMCAHSQHAPEDLWRQDARVCFARKRCILGADLNKDIWISDSMSDTSWSSLSPESPWGTESIGLCFLGEYFLGDLLLRRMRATWATGNC